VQQSGGRQHGLPVRIWQGGEEEYAISTRPPTSPPVRLCFDQNPDQTTAFFARIRALVPLLRGGKSSFVHRKSPESVPKIHGYIDFAKLHSISLSSAVVLAADYDRLAQLSGEVPPTINLSTWNSEVLTTLFQLGFFETLGHIPNLNEKLVQDGPKLTMKIVTAEDAGKLDEIDSSLQDLAKFLSGDELALAPELDDAVVTLLTSISEAITNVTQHAYPQDHEYEFEHVEKLWVSATADRRNDTLTVVVYDQGATIPVTYPRLSRTSKVLRFLRLALAKGKEFDYSSDGTYIRAAMRFGGSRTDKVYRGKGFPQMNSLVGSVGGGRLSIRSRNGWCSTGTGWRMRSGYVSSSLGGTLVELTVNVSSYLNGNRNDD
jgi:hypothetical protein